MCVSLCVHQIVLACSCAVSIPNKTKFLPLKRESIQRQCFSKYGLQNKQKCFWSLTILSPSLDLSDVHWESPGRGSGCQHPLISFDYDTFFCPGMTYVTNILQNILWEKLPLEEDKNFSFTPLFNLCLDLWGLLKPELI